MSSPSTADTPRRVKRSRFVIFFSNHIGSIIASILISAISLCLYFKLPQENDCVNLIQSFSFWQDMLLCVIGPIAFVYAYHSLVIFIFRPIKRDWLLSQGLYFWRVFGFVMAVPVALALIISFANSFTHLAKWSDAEFQSADMIYVAEMYGDYNSDCDCSDTENSAVDLEDEYGAKPHKPSILWTVFYHYIDPGNQHSTLSLAGRIVAGICAVLGVIFLNGLLVSVIVGMFDSKREKWKNGTARYVNYLRKKEFYVIIGGGEMDAHIVRSIFERVVPERCNSIFGYKTPCPYIVIQTSSDVEELRTKIYAQLDNDRYKRHVVIYAGSRTSENDIADLALECAKELYLIGEIKLEESEESMHDAYNMRCLEIVADYLKENTKSKDNKLRTYLMFEHQTTFSIYQFSEISERVKDNLDFRPINFYELWAQRVLINPAITESQIKASMYKPLEGYGIDKDSDEFVHLVIFGISRMGVALGIEAAHLAHYPNFVTKKVRTRITFIDSNMDQERNFFMGRFKGMFELARHRYAVAVPNTHNLYSDETCGKWVNPMDRELADGRKIYEHLGDDFIDIEWEFIDGTIENPVIHDYLHDAACNPNAKLTIAMCHADLNKAAAAAIYMPREIYCSDRLQQVLVYQRYDDSLFSQLSEEQYQTPFNGKLKAFGKIFETFDLQWLERRYEIAEEIQVIYDQSDSSICDLISIVLDGKREWTKPYKEAIDRAKSIVSKIHCDCNDDVVELDKMYPPKIKGKSSSAELWSNIYNANMLWTKLRCSDIFNVYNMSDCSDEQNVTKDELMWVLSYMEHNRWNVEQLLMTCKPLSYEEYCIWQTDRRNQGSRVKGIYKALMKHPDICSCDMLHNIDDTFQHDMKFSKSIKGIYEKYCAIKLQNDVKES